MWLKRASLESNNLVAMAVSCSCALVASLSSLSVSSSSLLRSQWKPALGLFSGHGIVSNTGFCNVRSSAALRTVIVHATGDVIEASTSDANPEEATPEVTTTTLSAAELLKRKAKKIELRRKRLVRKRKLRKKGKWPPSKMAKLKNV